MRLRQGKVSRGMAGQGAVRRGKRVVISGSTSLMTTYRLGLAFFGDSRVAAAFLAIEERRPGP